MSPQPRPRRYDGEVHLTDILDSRHRPTARELHEGEHLLALASEADQVPSLWPNLAELVDTTALDQAVLDAAERCDQTELAHMLVDLDDIRLRIALALQVLEDALIATMTTKTLEIEGLPVLEQRGGKARKAWQSDELLPFVVRKALVSRAPNANVDTVNSVYAVVDEISKAVPFTGSLGWRVTALKAMGIDPDEFCESSPSRRTVQIHRATQPAVIR